MSELRAPFLLIATGAQGIGKSYETLKQVIYQAYVSSTPRKALYFDTNGEYGEYEIDGTKHRLKTLKHSELISYSNSRTPEVRRICPFHPNGMPFSPSETEELLVKTINLFRGGILVIEDLNRIYGDALPQSIAGLLCNVRHRNCDVIFHLQSCGRILPKMRQNTKIIRYHYQIDSIEDSKDKLAGELQIFQIAEKIVNTQMESGNKYFFVYVYREIKKLKGDFSPRMLSTAIQDYISENEKVIRHLLNKRSIKGKKMYGYEEAVRIKTVELFKKYY